VRKSTIVRLLPDGGSDPWPRRRGADLAAERLKNDSRRDVPATIIACSYPSDVMMQMAHEGHPMMAEVATLRDLELIDLPTGHWPMWSRPADLAAAIATAAGH